MLSKVVFETQPCDYGATIIPAGLRRHSAELMTVNGVIFLVLKFLIVLHVRTPTTDSHQDNYIGSHPVHNNYIICR